VSGAGLTTAVGLGDEAGVDGGRIASAAMAEDAGAFVADKEEKAEENFLKAVAWGKEDVACLFMLARAAKVLNEEGQEVFRVAGTKKQDDDDDAASRRRASISKDMHRTRAAHGKRCSLCGNGRDMRGQGGGTGHRSGAGTYLCVHASLLSKYSHTDHAQPTT